jgi:hypothetical protein
MKPIHIQLDRAHPEARFSGLVMSRLEFRQALFVTKLPGWQRRLYPAALMVTTTAFDGEGQTIVVDHQSFRFGLLFNASWPEPAFLRIRAWHYKPVELKRGVPVAGWMVELRLRDLRLIDEERVEFNLLG